MTEETIFALASGGGPAGVAVIRVSGPAASGAVRALTGAPEPEPRRAVRRRFADPETGEPVDDGLLLWFPGPASFTGEDVAELHLHGGRAVIAAALEALGRVAGCRMAEAGEFTRRAFENGKLDLTQVEGVADLVNAETEAQRKLALREAGGGLSAIYDGWRDRLVHLLAHLEATIDFADEELPPDVMAKALADLGPLITDLESHLADGRGGEILRDGLSVVIVGAPNAGKSSILNRLAQREAAIVSEFAGTTRDAIDVHLSLGGFPVIVTDTAGLREVDFEGAGAIEAEGIRRARARADAADLTVAVFDATRTPDPETKAAMGPEAFAVFNKCDLPHEIPEGFRDALRISAATGDGIGELVARLTQAAQERMAGGAETVITRARHREAIEAALEHLRRAKGAAMPELIAEDLRLAARALGRVTGRVDVEDLLDVIFRDFCIGK